MSSCTTLWECTSSVVFPSCISHSHKAATRLRSTTVTVRTPSWCRSALEGGRARCGYEGKGRERRVRSVCCCCCCGCSHDGVCRLYFINIAQVIVYGYDMLKRLKPLAQPYVVRSCAFGVIFFLFLFLGRGGGCGMWTPTSISLVTNLIHQQAVTKLWLGGLQYHKYSL